jgi:magnesium-protoporphyrin O-methyltransferase
MPCSQCDAIGQAFDNTIARRQLRRFNRRGPIRTTRLLIDAIRQSLVASDVRDARLLDVGAGIGAIHHELLADRVSHALHVDASSAYITVARAEAHRRGHEGRVEFMLGDFVAVAGGIGPADIVTLDRVICCYPDMEQLVSRSAEKARRVYGAVYPRSVPWMRAAIWSVNLFQKMKGSAFRVFVHDPVRIDALLRAAGLACVKRRNTLGWEVVVYARDA